MFIKFPTPPPGDERKFRELVLYVSQKCATDPTFGATKLNKILFFSDFLSYGNLGKAITGVEYQKLPNGPAPRRLLPICDQMRRDGDLVLQEIPLLSGKTQKRTINLRAPDLKVFTAEEISLVDDVIEALDGARAEAVSALSHQLSIGWILVNDKETIPYNTVFLSNPDLTETEIERGKQLAEAFGLTA
jgi:hypothetical protein